MYPGPVEALSRGIGWPLCVIEDRDVKLRQGSGRREGRRVGSDGARAEKGWRRAACGGPWAFQVDSSNTGGPSGPSAIVSEAQKRAGGSRVHRLLVSIRRPVGGSDRR